MVDDCVLVMLKPEYPHGDFRGLCGFHILKGEQKLCPVDVYEAGKHALVCVSCNVDDDKKNEVVSKNVKKGKK